MSGSRPLPLYRIGDLVWCRWGGVWWPAMISYDPHSAVYFEVTDNSISAYHLQYFGIEARRGWARCKLLLPMKSTDEKKPLKPIIGKARKDYQVAMAEVKEAFGLNLKQRKLKFIFNFVECKRKTPSFNSGSVKIQKNKMQKNVKNSVPLAPLQNRPSSWKPSLVAVPPPTILPPNLSLQAETTLVQIENPFVSSAEATPLSDTSHPLLTPPVVVLPPNSQTETKLVQIENPFVSSAEATPLSDTSQSFRTSPAVVLPPNSQTESAFVRTENAFASSVEAVASSQPSQPLPPTVPMKEPPTVPMEEPPTVPMEEHPTIPIEEPHTVPMEEPPVVPMKEPTTVPMEEPPTVPMKEPPTVPMEEPPTVPMEEPPAVPMKEPTTVPMEEPHTVPMEEPTTVLMEEPPTVPMEEPPTVPMEEPPTVPMEEPPTVLMEEPPTVPMEEPPTVPMEEHPTVPMEEPPIVPREESPTLPTKEPSIPTLPIEKPHSSGNVVSIEQTVTDLPLASSSLSQDSIVSFVKPLSPSLPLSASGNGIVSSISSECESIKLLLPATPIEGNEATPPTSSSIATDTRRYPTRHRQTISQKKAEEIVTFSSQLSDSQGADSGFETGSDLSVTPVLQTTPTVTSMMTDHSDALSYLEFLDARQPSVQKSQVVSPATKLGGLQIPSPQTHVGSNLMCVTCAICDSDEGDIVMCIGHCLQGFHLDCLGIFEAPSTGFRCDECMITPTVCFKCKTQAGEQPLVVCSHLDCDKHYHLSCISSIKTFKVDNQKLVCGLHSCARCVGTGTSLMTTKLVQCIRCPLALHRTSCLVAGCELLNERDMVCYTHINLKSISLPQSIGHFNMNTCLDCGEAGSLVCCDFCSAAYHNHCLSEEHMASDSTQKWVCPCCLSHDLPTYESAVMCKCGTYRWWPAEVISDKCVPSSLHVSKPTACMFLVRFFGTEQYFWTHHGRVVTFTEDCLLDQHKHRSYASYTKRGQIQTQYSQAFEEALAYHRDRNKKIEALKQHKKESKDYIHIKRNKYLVPRPPVDLLTESCKCTSKSPCTPDSSCINRAMYTECLPSNCPVGTKCQNQKIRLIQNAPVKTFYTGGRGWGLKATNKIPCGGFVVEYIGEVLNKEMVRERLKTSEEKDVSNFYFLTLGNNLIIDASTKSNNARFINHSCDPNCQTQKWKVNGETRIGIFAIKDIPAGTELTFDYMLDSLGNEKKKCLCGSKNCSGFLGVRPKNAQDVVEAPESSPTSRKRKTSAVVFHNKHCKTDPYDDECFVCKREGKLLMCDYPNCCRVYHMQCVHLKRVPKGEFFCPRHLCVMCSAPTSSFCSNCPSAYCDTHKTGLIETSTDEYLCTARCHVQPTLSH